MRASLLATVGSLAIARSNAAPQIPIPDSSSQARLLDTTSNPQQAHFRNAAFDQHYDVRFAKQPVVPSQRQEEIKHLLSTYLSTMSDIGVTTLLSHATLLGWHRNGHIQPWDSTLTAMVPEGSLYHMARYYNMTVHTESKNHIMDPTRDYLLEINPHYQLSDPDLVNAVDARWINLQTGLYMSITTLRRSGDASHRNAPDEVLSVKDGSSLRFEDVFPLVATLMEGQVVNVPRATERILEAEFGAAALVAKTAPGHRFDEASRLWEPVKP